MTKLSRLTQFVNKVSRLTKDGECTACHTDGYEDDLTCDSHEPFDMESDDAVETLNLLIEEARQIRRESASGKGA